MNSICVYCGSNLGSNMIYKNSAIALGETLSERNIDLVYGGAKVGLMGVIADSVLQNGGKVTGVLPAFLQEKELAHQGLTELILVDTMHERKLKMNELSDGMIALPGGFGTLEELFEMFTWAQLGLHQKPVALLNTNGFYDGLITLIHHMVNEGFLKKGHQDLLLINDDVNELLDTMQSYTPPLVSKWITTENT